MITYEQAETIARKRNEAVNTVQEYADAYCFYVDDGIERAGGGEQGFLVAKKDGFIIRWADYFMDPSRDAVEVGGPRRLAADT